MGRKEKIQGVSPEAEASEASELNLKRYLEDRAYKEQMDLQNPYVNSLSYLQKIYELIGILKNDRLGFSEEQIDKIKKKFLAEFEKFSPLRAVRGKQEIVWLQISKDLAAAEADHEDAEEIMDEIQIKYPKEIETADKTESLNLRKFSSAPHYRLLLRQNNPYFSVIAEREKLGVLKKIIEYGRELNLTPAQTEILLELAGGDNGEESRPNRGDETSSPRRKKALAAMRKKETVTQEGFEKLRIGYLNGEFKTYAQFAAEVDKMLDKKLNKPAPDKEPPIQ